MTITKGILAAFCLAVGLIIGAGIGAFSSPIPTITSIKYSTKTQTVSFTALITTVKTTTATNTISLIQTLTETHLTTYFTSLHETRSITITKTISEVAEVCFPRQEECESMVISLIDGAKNYIHVMVYSFTSDALGDALIRAFNRGVKVKVIIEERNAYSTGSEIDKLKNAGINVAIDSNPYLMHHKVMIIDGLIVVTGSYNWSYSAEHRNDENLIVIISARVAQEYEDEFQRIWDNAIKLSRPTTTTQTTETTKTTITTHPLVKIYINEVEANPPGTDSGNEWVELYNPNDFNVDLKDWCISTTHGKTVTICFYSSQIIPARGYLIVGYGGQWIDNEEESLILQDSQGRSVDSTPLLDDTANDNRSWQRVPDGSNNWQFKTATPKAPN